MTERLLIPPIRTRLDEVTGQPAGLNASTGRTAKEWYYFWRQSGEQTNENTIKLDGLVTSGTIDSRPNADTMPEGALFTVTDRGNTLYQNRDGSWVYVSGTMLGTLSPDQRPTGLGADDRGFQFESTDTRELFAWSGTAWAAVAHTTRVSDDGAFVAARREINFVSGANVTVTATDDTPNDRVNVSISSTGGGTGGAVSSVFGRTGAVVAQPGDYSAAQVTGAVSTAGSYADPSWITSLAWSKVGDPTTTKGDLIARGSTAPATRLGVGTNGQVLTADSTVALGLKWAAAAVQTPWAQNIDGATFTLTNTGNIGAGTATPNYAGFAGATITAASAAAGGGNFESANTAADADGNLIGGMSFIASANTSGVRVAQIRAQVQGTTANNRGSNLQFYTKPDGAGIAERMRIDNQGRVGLNTTSPALRLEAKGTFGSPATSGSTQTFGIARFSQASGAGVLDVGFGDPGVVWMQAANSGDLATKFPIVLNPNGGNVGIGVSNPGSRLSVAGLPTSSAGLSSGDIWRDAAAGNVLKIVP